MSEWAEDFIWKEDGWLTTVRTTHHLFCDCGDWIGHLTKLVSNQHPEEWLMATGHAAGDGSRGTEGEDIPDEDLLAALEDAEKDMGDDGEEDITK